MTDTLSGELRPTFAAASTGRTRRRGSNPSRISLRLSDEELARLKDLAGDASVSAFVRERLFGGTATPRRRRPRTPVEDQEALAQVLGFLGQSRMASNLNQLAYHANCGSLVMDEETENEIKVACARIAWIRVKLIEALGLKSGERP